MSIFSYLLPKKEKSASVAKERLQIIVARERATRGGPDSSTTLITLSGLPAPVAGRAADGGA